MNFMALLMTTMAGISTIIGFFAIYVKTKGNNIIPYSLGFSAGVMIIISVIDLLPESLNFFKLKFPFSYSIFFSIFFMIIGISIALSCNSIIKKDHKDNLYRIGILSLITLILHNIPEGIITYLTTTIEFKMGLLLSLSIAAHNIPEGICIAIPIYYSTKSKSKTFFMVLVSALSELVGAIFSAIFLEKYISNTVIGVLLSLVSGIMLTLALTEILKEAKKYSVNKTLKALIIGITLAFLSHLLL